MGNQSGANPYQYYQPQASQIGQQPIPYGSFPSTAYQPATSSVITNYYQQGYPPSKWPSVTNLNQPQTQPNPIAGSTVQTSTVSDQNSARGSQAGQIGGSQLNSNRTGLSYGNPTYGVQYADQINLNPSFINAGGNVNAFGKKQRGSNTGSQIPQNPSQAPNNQSYIQQL